MIKHSLVLRICGSEGEIIFHQDIINSLWSNLFDKFTHNWWHYHLQSGKLV